jgi:hypothetical protein
MNKNKIILLMLSSGIWIGAQFSSAATIPAGTNLLVQTGTAISSQDMVGKEFHGRLLQNVALKGNVLLPAGTKVSGKVESRQMRIGSTTRPLVLKLTHISIQGRSAQIETQGCEPQKTAWKSRRGVAISGGSFVLPVGSTLEFRLAQPLTP